MAVGGPTRSAYIRLGDVARAELCRRPSGVAPRGEGTIFPAKSQGQEYKK